MRARALRESRVEAERLVLGTRSALTADGDLLGAAERADIESRIDAVQRSAAGDDHRAIDAAVEGLAQGTEGFAAERMNRGIRDALAGRRIADL